MLINILYQFNEKYAPYAGVSITSVLENNKDTEGIIFWILGEGLSEESLRKLNDTVASYSMLKDSGEFFDCKKNNDERATVRKIIFVDSSELVEEMKALNMPTYRGSYAANMRLFVSRFIPEDVDKLLYLDADTVVTASLQEIFEKYAQDKPMAMVYDSIGEGHKKEINIDDDEGYYNSGVILFNMKLWRSEQCTERIIEHVKNVRAQYPSPDQDLLNLVVKKGIETLPIIYNYQTMHGAYCNKVYFLRYGKTRYYTPEEIDDAKDKAVIYHYFRFVGEFPWHKDNVHPFNDQFDKYLAISKWSDYEKKVESKSFVVKFEKILYKLLPKSIFIRIFYIAHRIFYSNANRQSQKGKISKKM